MPGQGRHFVLDEEKGLLIERTKGLGVDLEGMVARGELALTQIDAAEMAPGEFAQMVRACVETYGARTGIIDSLNCYQAAMPEERQLILHMHELLQFLNRQGAATFLTVAQHGLVGDMKTPVDVTYLADAVVLLRYFGAADRVCRAIRLLLRGAAQRPDERCKAGQQTRQRSDPCSINNHHIPSPLTVLP